MIETSGKNLSIARARAGGLMVAVLCGLAAMAWSAPRLAVDRSMGQLFVSGGEARAGFESFHRHFGTDDILLVVFDVPGGTALCSPVLTVLHECCETLDADPAVAAVNSLTRLQDFDVATTFGISHPSAPRPMVSIDPGPDEQRRRALVDDPLLRSGLIGPGGRSVACWVLLDPELKSSEDYGDEVRRIAALVPTEVPGLPEARVLVTGPPLLLDAGLNLLWRDAVRLFFVSLLVVAVALAATGVPLRALLCFLAAWPPILGLLMLGTVLSGHRVHAFTGAVGPLLLISGAATFVHCIHASGAETRRRTRTRCFLATLGTAAAFLPLAWSELGALRSLGLEMALGISLAYVGCVLAAATSPTSRPHKLRALPSRGRWVVVVLALCSLPWFLAERAGPTSTERVPLLPPDHPAVLDLETAADSLGSPGALEIVLTAQDGEPLPLLDPEFLAELGRLEESLVDTGRGDIESVFSPATFVRAVDTRMQAPGQETTPRFEVSDRASRFCGTWLFGPYLLGVGNGPQAPNPAIEPLFGPLRQLLSPDGVHLRIACRTPLLAPHEVLALRDQLEAGPLSGVELSVDSIVTGSAVLLAEAELELHATQRRSLMLSAVLLAGLFLAVARNLRAAALAVLTNLAAWCAWRNLVAGLDQGFDAHRTVLCVTLLSVIVDDTLHLLAAWRQNRFDADGGLRRSLEEVADPILRSSAALCLGFLAFFGSELPAYRSFALWAPAGILLALGWDLWVLPRWLARRR